MNASNEELQHLLQLASTVVTWTTQDVLKRDAAGYEHLVRARQAFYKARIDIQVANGEPLTTLDTGGCTCGWRSKNHEISDTCMYHYAARLQPDNHRIPWNCPTYYDGCNCNE